MISVLNSGSIGPGSRPVFFLIIIFFVITFLDREVNSDCAYLHQGVQKDRVSLMLG